jgi:hypothetical protein
MKRTTLLALTLSAIPAAVQAQSITGGITLSYTSQEADGLDQDTTGLDGRMKVAFDNGFSFGLQLGRSETSLEGTSAELEGEFYALDGNYRFANGMRVGAFTERLTIGVDLVPTDVSLDTDGVLLGYEGNGFDVEAFVGTTSVDLISFIDVDNYGITASYTGKPGLEVGGAFLRARLSSGGTSENIDFTGIAATYAFNTSYMVFGGFAKSDFFIGDSLDSMGLGLGYDLGELAGFSSTVSLELARTDLGGDDIDTVRFGLTVPLGKKGPMLPLNSVADSVLNPRHGAFNAGITAAF